MNNAPALYRPVKPACSVTGCEKQASKKGMCEGHYLRNYRYGTPFGGRKPQAPLCTFEGCQRRDVQAQNLCGLHYGRWLKHGDPAIQKRPEFVQNRGRTCQADGCDTAARSLGYCQKHYECVRRRGSPEPFSYVSVEERFWAKVDFSSDCWLWQDSKHDGYGTFLIGSRADKSRKSVRAHRWAYEYIIGPVPEGLILDHLCRNRACVNPFHLEPVTHRVNILRGTGYSARHARKTHCPQGHSYEGENLLIDRGSRKCRACRDQRHRLERAS